MEVVICGAGEVGRHTAEVFAPRGDNVILLDRDPTKLAECESLIDIRTLEGDGTRAATLKRAGVDSADLFIAATHNDEVNLIAASIAASAGCDTTIARIHHQAYFEGDGLNYAAHFGIDHLVCPEHTTAAEIATTLRSPGAEAVEDFAGGAVQLHRVTVKPGSKAVGVRLADLALPRCCLVVSVERGGETFRPNADSELTGGDRITVLAEEESMAKAFKLFGVDAPRRYRVMVMGGSSQAIWLCRQLRSRNYAVRLFEADPVRAEMLSEKLSWVTVLCGDVINSGVLLDERVDTADAFIAMTEDDETNILAAARAKSMQTKASMVVLQRSTYFHLLKHIGIDKAFTPRATAVKQITRLLDTGPLRHISALSGGAAEIYEARVSKSSAGTANRKISEIDWPENALVAVRQRDGKAVVPSPEDTLMPGDTAILIAPAGTRKTLKGLFAS